MPQQDRHHDQRDRHKRYPLSVRFTDSDWTWLEAQAAKTGRPVRAIVANAVHEYRVRLEEEDTPDQNAPTAPDATANAVTANVARCS